MRHDAEHLKHIGEAFELPGDFISAEPYGSGHINDTYLARRMVDRHLRDFDYARETAHAFGRFQADLADLPGERLHETIPWFHHTPHRFADLEAAIARDVAGRADGAAREIDFCLQRRPQTTVITDLMEQGAIPERIAHNDTKLNNVMIDNRTGRGICVIDLDTVMSGCVLYDFGDMVRSTTRTGNEDERDLRVVNFDLSLFEALSQGYLTAVGHVLNDAEREHLAFAGRLVTMTIGIRFLTDYLDGDRYFKTHRPGQNLDRTRVQFKMLENMEQAYDRMRHIIDAQRH
ncbi:MAG: aminoglycoside phosphotransferase family protein [Lentisphaerae bacterium]|nr:aminoglycoside phosphotransferase family protein [Lentisphaerota bacterium]